MPHQSLTAGRVAAAVGGELLGPDDLPITGVAPLDEAGTGDLAFLDGSRHLDAFRDTRATVVLIRQQHAHAATSAPARIVVAARYLTTARVAPAARLRLTSACKHCFAGQKPATQAQAEHQRSNQLGPFH